MTTASVLSGVASYVFPQPRSRRPTRVAWPLTVLIAGYPLWWLCGLGTIGVLLVAIPMTVTLWRRRPLRLPPGFGVWLLFLFWVMLSTVMLSGWPDGTLPGSWHARMGAAVLTRGNYLAATVALLFVGNLTERELPRRRAEGLLALMFTWIVAGGVLGLLVPDFSFTSPLELILPGGLVGDAATASIIHPTAAQQQEVLGYATPRPSAPWGYTNIWGNNFGIMVVWFVYWWLTRGMSRLWTRIGGGLVLFVGALVAVYSLNRGLWIALGGAAAYALVRAVRKGGANAAVAVGGSVAALVALVMLSPAATVIGERFSTGHSNSARSFSIEQTFPVTAQSPVLGWGGPREVVGSESSIAVGRSEDCPRCGNIPLGANGQLWFMLVGQGVVGALAYVAYFVRTAWIYRKDNSAFGIAAGLLLLLPLWFMLVYNAAPSPVFFYLLSAGMIWRYGRTDRERTNRWGRETTGADVAVAARA